MVFFTCDACGESLKKAQVEKHVLKCRSCQVLSCIDCGKDFCGDDYKNHIRCITEDQKYGGRDFQAKANKGDVKQQQWIERIQEAISQPNIEPKLQQVLQKISTYDNVPRKRAKFENWMKSCLKIHSPLLLQQVWTVLSTTADDGKQSNHQTASERENRPDLNNGTKTEEDTNKKNKSETKEEQNGQQTKKKRKREQKEQNADQNTNKKQKKSTKEALDESLTAEGEEPESQESESKSTGKFNWKGTIKAVLRDAPEDGLAVKKLRKKVLSAYYSFSGERNFRSEEELLSLFNRKISSNPKFRVLKDKVRLVK